MTLKVLSANNVALCTLKDPELCYIMTDGILRRGREKVRGHIIREKDSAAKEEQLVNNHFGRAKKASI